MRTPRTPEGTEKPKWMLFADESGIDSSYHCYGIGILALPVDRVERFDARFKQLLGKHGVAEEVKWTKIRKGHGMINLAIDLLKDVLRSKTARFTGMVVKKSIYKKWHGGDRENAFYTTYSLLLNSRLDLEPSECSLLMDEKKDEYDKQEEVVQIVTNRMAQKIASTGRLIEVSKVDSKKHFGVQAADILTGAITSGHNVELNPSFKVAPGKSLLIKRLASVLGWDGLHYDTWPNKRFNIWHFPDRKSVV